MNLTDRTRDFALRVIRLCTALPTNRTNDVIARQLLKAGTSPGAHFREAIRARSKAEYVAKLNGGLMELEETLSWPAIAEGAGPMTARNLAPLTKHTTLLTTI